MSEWQDYATTPPTVAGPYEWLVPSRSIKGMIVRVLAHFRERGAGYTKALSPEFDHWDGYRLHVPHGTMWRTAPEGTELKPYRQELLCIEGLEITPCPFCRQVPKIKGIQRYAGGTILSADPHELNTWWFECCQWARTPHMSDPREIERMRRSVLSLDRDPKSNEVGE